MQFYQVLLKFRTFQHLLTQKYTVTHQQMKFYQVLLKILEFSTFLTYKFAYQKSNSINTNQTYQVFVQSSDKARAIVSAQSLLYGFFPPAAHERFDSAINWHPIPVHCSGVDDEDPVSFKIIGIEMS
jgi:hypothetical protein